MAAVGAVRSLNEQAKLLNCHFNWDIAKNIQCSYSDRIEAKLLNEIQGNPDVKNKALLLLSFVFTVKDKSDTFNLQKALDYANDVIKNTSSKGEEFVALANRFNILHKQRHKDASALELQKLQAKESDLRAPDRAVVALVESYAISVLSFTDFKRARQRCEEAIALDPSLGEAHFNLGLIIGRLRRGDNGPYSHANSAELEAFQQAMLYWPTSPLPHVFYACAIAPRLKNHRGQVNATVLQEMDHHLSPAIDLAVAHKHGTALYRCSKALRYIARLDGRSGYDFAMHAQLERYTIEEALKTWPGNTSVLHEAALCYWKTAERFQNLEKAEKYLREACDTKDVIHDNVFADIDLIKLQKRMNPKFDNLTAMAELAIKYEGLEQSKPQIHIELGWIYLKQEEDLDRAYDEFETAIKLRPESSDFRHALEQAIKAKRARAYIEFCAGRLTHDVYIDEMLRWADSVQICDPPNKELAVEFYNLVLQLDPNNSIGKTQLSLLLAPVSDDLDTTRELFADLQLTNPAVKSRDNDGVIPSTREFYEATRSSKVRHLPKTCNYDEKTRLCTF